MISKIENKSNSGEWEKETMTPNFNLENLWRDQKPQAYNLSKTSTMKNKNWIQSFT